MDDVNIFTKRSLAWCKKHNHRPDLLVMNNDIPCELIDINDHIVRVVSTILPHSYALATYVEYLMQTAEEFIGVKTNV